MRYNKLKILFNLFILILVTLTVASCSKKRNSVVAKIGDEKIYMYEFENSFLKLTPYPDSLKFKTLEQKKEMLNQYISLRLKAKDARDKGLLDSSDIQQDIREYRKSLLISVFEDKNIISPYVEKVYDRRKSELRVSHILLNLSTNASPEDSTKAYKKAEEIINRLKKGEDFPKLTEEYSDDGGTKKTGGDLYYITGGKVIPEFEDAAYSLKEGDYTTTPVRTAYGLHIIKVTAKSKRVEKIKVSHILIQDTRDSAGVITDSIGTLEKAKLVLNRVKKGEEFEKVAQEVSQDPGSATRGGDLGYVERRRFVLPFDSVAFTLKLNEVSGLVRTQYGWHIIKVTAIDEMPSLEKTFEAIKTEYKRSEMFRKNFMDFMNQYRKKYDFELNSNAVQLFYSKLDSSKSFVSFNWDSIFSSADTSLLAAKFKGGEIKIADIIKYIKSGNNSSGGNGANYKNVIMLFEDASNQIIENYAAIKENLDKSDEFTEQYKEFEIGLLKHKADQIEISSKLKITEQEISNYYTENKSKFTYKDGDTLKYRAVDEVRTEITSELQNVKQKDLEKIYVDALRVKYPVEIFDSVLEKAFKD